MYPTTRASQKMVFVESLVKAKSGRSIVVDLTPQASASVRTLPTQMLHQTLHRKPHQTGESASCHFRVLLCSCIDTEGTKQQPQTPIVTQKNNKNLWRRS